MIQIRPISDLRNECSKIEKIVQDGQTVYLTKNGYGSMVIMSLDKYTELIDDVEIRIEEIDKEAKMVYDRYNREDVLPRMRRTIEEKSRQ